MRRKGRLLRFVWKVFPALQKSLGGDKSVLGDKAGRGMVRAGRAEVMAGCTVGRLRAQHSERNHGKVLGIKTWGKACKLCKCRTLPKRGTRGPASGP